MRGLIEMGLSISEIARRLGRHRATIHREIGRNRCASGYRPDSADRRAWARKLRGSRIGIMREVYRFQTLFVKFPT